MSDLSRFVANKLSGEWSASNVSGVLTDVIIEVGAALGCGAQQWRWPASLCCGVYEPSGHTLCFCLCFDP